VPAIICRVKRPRARVASRVLLAPFLVFATGLAPLHAHEPADDHSSAVVHAHFAPHEFHDEQGPAFDHGAEKVVWLDSAIIHTVPYELASQAANVVGGFDLIVPATSSRLTAVEVAAPAHGPPRLGSQLRAPPASSLI
jgi:hypothetical protein